MPDQLVWTHSSDGLLTAKGAYNFLHPPKPSLCWARLIWWSFIPPSVSFILWRLILGKMATDHNLLTRGCVLVLACPALWSYPAVFLICKIRAPTLPYVKVNTDGSRNFAFNAASGGLFRDSRASFLGAFACNLGQQSVLFYELSAIILAIEFTRENGWDYIWIESDSSSAL
ncbi:RNA-directed DNA polymerase (Reverse transcriptase) [Trifolium medium]|uniref:RNA-directed DNA polymerase (Reverse transcriptase) n=1 Tax=Trifolium medium TaxID=97028 RepID=A0A392M2W0_9FABA|nr:RNA-directed DNA polymerase (Reverse transcriptase) [Trifolium medium]